MGPPTSIWKVDAGAAAHESADADEDVAAHESDCLIGKSLSRACIPLSAESQEFVDVLSMFTRPPSTSVPGSGGL